MLINFDKFYVQKPSRREETFLQLLGEGLKICHFLLVSSLQSRFILNTPSSQH